MSPDPLIMLTGVACDAELWRAQREALAEITECTVIDPQGHSIDEMAEHVLAIAPPRFGLAGLSMGGYVALAILSRAPTRVARLCLANTSARADSAAQSLARQALINDTERGAFESVLDRLLPVLTHVSRHADMAFQAAIMAMMLRVGAPAFLRQQIACGARPDSRAALSRIAVPTCVIAGAQDRVTPASHAAEIAAAISGASLHVLQDCAHLSPMEQPGRVTAIMRDWLVSTQFVSGR